MYKLLNHVVYFGWDNIVVSINVGAQVASLLIIIVYETLCGHWCCLGQVLYFGRAPRTKKTLLDFRERCRVNRHQRVFRGLTGSQRTPRIWGVTS